MLPSIFTEFSHAFVVLMKSKSGTNIDDDLKIYFKEVGVPTMVICDVSREKIKGDLFLI